VTTATVLTTGAAIVGAGASIYGTMSANSRGQASYDYSNQANMAIGRRQAAIARDRAVTDAEDIAANTRRTLGTVRANAGASGLLVEEGSPLEVLVAGAGAGELSRQRRLWEGEMEAQDAMVAAEASQRSFSPNYTAYGAAGAQLLTGVSRVRDLLNSGGGSKPKYNSIDELIATEGLGG
jgi:hypothetical protein